MSGIATAIGVSAVIGAGAAYLASESQKDSAEKGIKSEERMADRNIEFQKEMEAQQRADFEPWRESGQKALDQIWEGLETGEFDVGQVNLEDDPGYKVRMQEGIDAVDASAAARGRLLSGAQQKALTSFGQEQGSKEYANAYARQANDSARRFNILSGLSQSGQSSAARQAQATSQLAQTGGNIMSNTGRAQNIAQQNIGAARAGGYQDGAQVINQAAQNWLTYKLNSPATSNNAMSTKNPSYNPAGGYY